METKTLLITGATDGIGRTTALTIAERGHRVLVHGRDPARVEAVVVSIRERTGAPDRASGVVADLSSMAAVRSLAREVAELAPRLDVLVNNAGVFMKERRLTEDGFETTWAVNHLAPFLLTHLLRDNLASAAPARVVTVSSVAHNRGRIHWDDVSLARTWDGPQAGPQSPGYKAYAQSKLANVLFANALARRVESLGITSNSLHPGVIGTKLLRQGFGMQGASLDEGAATSIHLALSDQVARTTGRYFTASRETQPLDVALDTQAQERLWQLSAEAVGVDA